MNSNSCMTWWEFMKPHFSKYKSLKSNLRCSKGVGVLSTPRTQAKWTKKCQKLHITSSNELKSKLWIVYSQRSKNRLSLLDVHLEPPSLQQMKPSWSSRFTKIEEINSQITKYSITRQGRLGFCSLLNRPKLREKTNNPQVGHVVSLYRRPGAPDKFHNFSVFQRIKHIKVRTKCIPGTRMLHEKTEFNCKKVLDNCVFRITKSQKSHVFNVV